MQKLTTGQKVLVSKCAGVDSGKSGVIVPVREVGINHRGIPNIAGAYKPLAPDDCVIRLNAVIHKLDGSVWYSHVVMSQSYLIAID
jgi:hypothetical protein